MADTDFDQNVIDLARWRMSTAMRSNPLAKAGHRIDEGLGCVPLWSIHEFVERFP